MEAGEDVGRGEAETSRSSAGASRKAETRRRMIRREEDEPERRCEVGALTGECGGGVVLYVWGGAFAQRF